MYGDLLLDRLGVKFLGPAPHGACSAKTASGGGEPVPVALPGSRMKPPIGQGGAEREHVAVRGMVISDAAIWITVLRMSNDLRQKRFPRRADEHHTCPRGKHGCAIKFHFSESEQNVLP
jgi:hypothetical protein